MSINVYELLEQVEAKDLIGIFDSYMDDYLYILDLQKDRCRISQRAVERFHMSTNSYDDAINHCILFAYEEDRPMLADNLKLILEGKQKTHNLLYRWLDKNGMPVWINCRGGVIDDEEGKPRYLIGCINETGKKQRADNTSGLLGEEEMRAYIRSHRKEGGPGFLMHIGSDDFDSINSAFGTDYGDYILKNVAACIKECLSDGQQLYHLVSDEFMIVDFQEHTAEDAVQLYKKICRRIEVFNDAERYKAVFTVSAGVIDASVTNVGYDEYRKVSDFALKQAKSAGKDSLYLFRQEDYDAFLRKGRLIMVLRNAVMNGFEGFEVYYQPIVDSNSEKILGAEALMRFTDRSEGQEERISPVEFIPLLEETGLIIPVGKFLLDQSMSMCSEMQSYAPGFKININISYIQITKSDVFRDIVSALDTYRLAPECVCVELTESGYIDLTPSFCELRKNLYEKGIQFIIDDFGTGYSNLHCINDMHPNYIKIDRSFTLKAMNHTYDYELLIKAIEMVHSVNVKICIEGIEEREWLQRLRQTHVDYMQGYLFGKPCEKDKFLSLVSGK